MEYKSAHFSKVLLKFSKLPILLPRKGFAFGTDGHGLSHLSFFSQRKEMIPPSSTTSVANTEENKIDGTDVAYSGENIPEVNV